MKILQINNIDLPGKVFNGYNLINDLNPLFFDVKQKVVIKESLNKNVDKLLPNYRAKLLYKKLIEYEKHLSINNMFSISSELLINSPEYKEADIIHFHLFHNTKLSISSLFKISKEKKVVITLHDPWFLTGRCVHFYDCEKWQTGCKKCRFLDTLFPFAEDNCEIMWNLKKNVFDLSEVEIIVASEWMLNNVKNSPIFANVKNVHLVPFGINLNKYKPLKNKKEIKEKLKIPEENIVIFLRAQTEFKGTEYILKALQNLETTKKITILTCDQKGLLKALESKYSINDLGYINEEEMIRIFNICDIFLMPSKSESFGLMAVEAMACEKPVIIFNNTALPSITKTPKCGYLVKNKDYNDLTNAIKFLVENENDRKQRGKLGRKLCKEKYSHKEYIQKLETIYSKLYEKPAPKSDNKNIIKGNLINIELIKILQQNIDNYLKYNKLENLDKIHLKKLNIYEINMINEYIYQHYFMQRTKIKLNFSEYIKKIAKENKLIMKFYNFCKNYKKRGDLL